MKTAQMNWDQFLELLEKTARKHDRKMPKLDHLNLSYRNTNGRNIQVTYEKEGVLQTVLFSRAMSVSDPSVVSRVKGVLGNDFRKWPFTELKLWAEDVLNSHWGVQKEAKNITDLCSDASMLDVNDRGESLYTLLQDVVLFKRKNSSCRSKKSVVLFTEGLMDDFWKRLSKPALKQLGIPKNVIREILSEADEAITISGMRDSSVFKKYAAISTDLTNSRRLYQVSLFKKAMSLLSPYLSRPVDANELDNRIRQIDWCCRLDAYKLFSPADFRESMVTIAQLLDVHAQVFDQRAFSCQEKRDAVAGALQAAFKPDVASRHTSLLEAAFPHVSEPSCFSIDQEYRRAACKLVICCARRLRGELNEVEQVYLDRTNGLTKDGHVETLKQVRKSLGHDKKTAVDIMASAHEKWANVLRSVGHEVTSPEIIDGLEVCAQKLGLSCLDKTKKHIPLLLVNAGLS